MARKSLRGWFIRHLIFTDGESRFSRSALMGKPPPFQRSLLLGESKPTSSNLILRGLAEQMVTSHPPVPTLPITGEATEIFLVQIQRYSDNTDKALNSNEFQVQVGLSHP